MKRIITFILIFFSVSLFSEEPVGYEQFKLGMSVETFKSIFFKDYQDEWQCFYQRTIKGNNCDIIIGYSLKNKIDGREISLEFTEGTSGVLSAIVLTEDFKYNIQSSIIKYNDIKNILLKKYGKPILPEKKMKSKSQYNCDTFYSIKWRVSKTQEILLELQNHDNCQEEKNNSSNDLRLYYFNYELRTLASKYQKNVEEDIKNEKFKSESQKY